MLAVAAPAFAAGGGPTLNGVIDNLTNWIVGILAGVATLFLTIGGLRYLTAGATRARSRRPRPPSSRRPSATPWPSWPRCWSPSWPRWSAADEPAVPLRVLLRWRPRHPRLLLAVGGLVVVLALGRRQPIHGPAPSPHRPPSARGRAHRRAAVRLGHADDDTDDVRVGLG